MLSGTQLSLQKFIGIQINRGKEERKGKGFPCRGHTQKGGELKGVGSLTCLREGGKRLARYTEIGS